MRDWDTRSGSIALALPKLRRGSYFPDWLLEPRRRAEQALRAVVAECYLHGLSTRRVDDVVKAMGIKSISKSEVSRLAQDLDERVEQFRNRPLDASPYRYIWIDALVHKCREGGRIANVATAIANRAALLRLVGAVLSEQHDEWQVVRRYMTFDEQAPLAALDDPRPSEQMGNVEN